jgi:catechol 2,3-dioxygenase-like lactoylglutathione lyase family enzyme
MSAIQKLGNAFVEATDFQASVDFYERLLGTPPEFVDDEHGWAQFDVGNAKLAVARRGSHPAANDRGATVSLKTDSADAWSEGARGRGLSVGAVDRSAHEHYVRIQDPDGNSVVVYARA